MAFREIIIVPVWEDHHLVHPGWMEAVGYPASLPLPGQPTQKYTHTNHVSSLIFFCKKGGTMIMMMMVMILMIIMMMMMVMILMIIIMMMMMMMVEGEWLLFLFFLIGRFSSPICWFSKEYIPKTSPKLATTKTSDSPSRHLVRRYLDPKNIPKKHLLRRSLKDLG